MQTKRNTDGSDILRLIFPLLVMLVNPVIRLVDIFPDFIACFILARGLSFFAERAPYFAEARDLIIKLGWLSILRIPAFAIAAVIKSSNVADNDITVLFTFVFAVGECYLLTSAVKNLFSGLFYLGMRGDGKALLPFDRNKSKTMRPETLRALTYAFAVFKAASSALPEMLLLSRTDEIGVTTKLFNFRALYPYFVIVLVPLVFILGILLARLFARYIRTVAADGALRENADRLLDTERRAELEKKQTVRRISGIFTMIFAAALLSVDLRLSDFSMIDLVPNFIPAVLFFIAGFKMTRETKHELISLAALSSYGIFSALSCWVEFGFLDSFGYSALEKSPRAAEIYGGVILTSALELLALICAVTALSYTLLTLLKRCGVGALDETAPEFSRKKRKEVRLRTVAFALLATALGAAKFLYVFFNSQIKSTLVATDVGIGAVTAGLVPWFGTLVFALWLAFAIYTYFFTEYLKEEIKLKLI